MLFCEKCGTQSVARDIFCGNCGTRFNKTGYIEINNSLKQFLNLILGMIIRPASTIANAMVYVDKQFLILMTVALTIGSGLFTMILTHSVVSAINIKVAEFITGATIRYDNAIHFPYANLFAEGMLVYIVTIGVIAAGIYLMVKFIFKGEINVLDTCKVIVISSIPIFVGQLVAMLFSYMSFEIAIGAVLLGITVSIISLYTNIKLAVDLPEDELIWVIGAVYAVLIMIVIAVIHAYVLSSISDLQKAIIKGLF